MNRRDFNKTIEIYETTQVSDGFGGYTVSWALLDIRWAKVDPLTPGNAITEYGLQDPSRAVQVTVRKNDLDINQDHVIKYRDKTYMLISGPIELDFKNKFLQFVMQEQPYKVNVEQAADETLFELGFYEGGFYEGATS